MKKLFSLFVALIVATSLFASDVITYTASSKLFETTDAAHFGLHTNAFNVSISLHTFSNGTGTITFAADVTTIGDYAFKYCSELTSVTIPNSVRKIGNEAFYNCSGLTSVTIGYSVTTIEYEAFYGCTGLTSVTIPNSVTTIGNYAFAHCSGLTSVTIPNSVKKIGNGAFDDVNNIVYNGIATWESDDKYWGAKCVNGYVDSDLVYSDATKTKLCGCSSAATGVITIPNSVTTIEKYAFRDCSGLTSVTIPNSVTTIRDYAFYGCSGLTSVTIPNSVRKIGWYAFSGCSGLTSVTIGNSVTTIGDDAFYNCKGLTSITIPNSVTTIGDDAFYNCKGLTSITIPNSVTTIGDYAFSGCSGLTSVTIPDSVTTIGDYAFYHVNNIVYNGTAAGSPWGAKCVNGCVDGYLVYRDANKTKLCGCSSAATGVITIPNSVTTIGESAFSGCSGLTSVTIPNSVTTIGESAFSGCSGLTSVTIPDSVKEIRRWAFRSCTGLTSVTIPNSVTTIGKEAFWKCSGLTSVTIPNFVTTIGDGAFEYCYGLISVTIPNSVTSIGNSAFYQCSGWIKTNYTGTIADWCKIKFGGPFIYDSHNFYINDVEVKDLVIPEGVDTIGDYAFYYCYGLTSVTIPNSVKTIGDWAFRNCSGLTSITSYATTPPTCGSSCFYNVSKSIPVYVPAQSINAYKQAEGWKDFTNIQANPEDFAVVTCIAVNGTIEGAGKYIKGDACTLTANPNYGYHFSQWSDGSSANPRSFVITQDTAFTAEFAINIYSFDVQTAAPVMGSVAGTKGNYEHGTSLEVSVTPNYGYHFDHWSDGNKQSQRTILLTKDTSLIAYFTKNIYSVNVSKYQHGIIQGVGNYDYLSTCTLVVMPDLGYEFVGWTDGNTDNPRSVVVTQDTIFEVLCELARFGTCGDNLMWNYNDGILVISGTGAMYDYTQGTAPWTLFKDSISSLVINNGCTSIGNFAFYGLSNKNLKTIDIPNSVEQIGQYAFANCEYVKNLYLGLSLEKIAANAFANDERLLYITCYAIEPPLLDESAFVNYDAYLSVPCESQADYKVAKGWKLFNKENVSCIGAEEKSVTTDEVTIAPEANQATFTWPANPSADGYSLEITKDGVVFCTLKFNAQGQLTGIAFAPSRDGAREMAAATMTANGWQFTVTGLNQGSKYGYTLDVLNADQQSIKHYEGEFTTTGGISTDLYSLPNDEKRTLNSKFIIHNSLYLFRNGKMYNALGF